MSTTDKLIFTIPQCRGFSDEAVAFMLLSWLKVAAEDDRNIGDAFRELKFDYGVPVDQIEELAAHTVQCLMDEQIFQSFRDKPAVLRTLHCDVSKNHVYVEAVWQ